MISIEELTRKANALAKAIDSENVALLKMEQEISGLKRRLSIGQGRMDLVAHREPIDMEKIAEAKIAETPLSEIVEEVAKVYGIDTNSEMEYKSWTRGEGLPIGMRGKKDATV